MNQRENILASKNYDKIEGRMYSLQEVKDIVEIAKCSHEVIVETVEDDASKVERSCHNCKATLHYWYKLGHRYTKIKYKGEVLEWI